MAGLNDYPDLKVAFDKLMEEKEMIRDVTAPLWEEYAALRAKVDPLRGAMRKISKEIQAIERPRMAEIDTQLAAIARATGGRSTGGA